MTPRDLARRVSTAPSSYTDLSAQSRPVAETLGAVLSSTAALSHAQPPRAWNWSIQGLELQTEELNFEFRLTLIRLK